MPISYRMLARQVRHVLGNQPAAEVSPALIIDMAQEWLVGMRAWRFLQNAEAYVVLRPRVDFTGAAWDETAKTIKEVGAFADYDWLAEDHVEVTGGTGVVAGFYEVTAATDDALTLSGSIKSSAAADVEGTLHLVRASLPADFASVLDLSGTGNDYNCVDWITPARMNKLRDDSSGYQGSGSWKVCIEHVGTPRVPVLEYFPEVLGDPVALRLSYNRGALRPETTDPDSTVLDWPDWMQPLLLETVRAYATGMEPTKQQLLSLLLGTITTGPVWQAAVNRDARMQSYYGVSNRGAARGRPRGPSDSLASEPQGPSA